MFTLLHGLYSSWAAGKEYNVLILGPGGAGQTVSLFAAWRRICR